MIQIDKESVQKLCDNMMIILYENKAIYCFYPLYDVTNFTVWKITIDAN